MKTKSFFSTIAFACVLVFTSCKPTEKPQSSETKKPINITIFIDLSDRILKNEQLAQMEKDTAIVGYIADYFLKESKDNGIQESQNRIKVLFYPEPQGTAMVKCADDLNVDIQKCKEGAERKNKVKNVKETFQKSLEQVYTQAIKDSNFPGCDIWGFFSNKKVDIHCISDNHRNILFVLTDGYILDEKTMERNGDISNYISSKILTNPNAELEVGRTGLENLEVAFLEINPQDPKHLKKMTSMIENWLKGMGIKEENITISDTGLPVNTKRVIESFLN